MSKCFGYPALRCQCEVIIVTSNGPCVTPWSVEPAAPTARPQQPWVQPEWADRSVNQWLPESVFKRSLVCTLSFLILFIYFSILESHTWQPQGLIARQMRVRNNRKGVVGCLGSYAGGIFAFVRFRCTIAEVHFLTCKSSFITNKTSFRKFSANHLKKLTTFWSFNKGTTDFTPLNDQGSKQH